MDNKQAIEMIKKILESLQYGNITIVVQNGTVVQIEKNEKIRINN